MNNWTWQDYLVFAAIVYACVYLWRKMIAPRLRRESGAGACDKCGAHQALTQKRGVKIVKLTPGQSERMRSELE